MLFWGHFFGNKKSIVKYITIQWHCIKKKTDYVHVLMINEALN